MHPTSLPPLLPALSWANLLVKAREQLLWTQLEGQAACGVSQRMTESKGMGTRVHPSPGMQQGSQAQRHRATQPALLIQMWNRNNSFLGSTDRMVTGKHNILLILVSLGKPNRVKKPCIISKWLSLLW